MRRGTWMPDLLVDIIKSFNINIKDKFKVERELSEEIEVNKDLRQRSTMIPTLFNLHASVVAEK